MLQILYPLTLSGVIYGANKIKLDNALVLLTENIVHNTITDSKGEFLIQNIEKNICVIQISHIG